MARRSKPRRGQFRSKFEWLIALDLYERKRTWEYEAVVLDYEQKVYKGVCADCGSSEVKSARKYTPDWLLPNGILVESKGNFTPKNRTLMLDVIEANPDRDIRMLFQADNFMTRKKVGRYSDWCNKKGIKYAIGRIPDEWFEE